MISVEINIHVTSAMIKANITTGNAAVVKINH